jgi:hypothetical protein
MNKDNKSNPGTPLNWPMLGSDKDSAEHQFVS